MRRRIALELRAIRTHIHTLLTSMIDDRSAANHSRVIRNKRGGNVENAGQGPTPDHLPSGKFKPGNQAARAAKGTPKQSRPRMTVRQQAIRQAREAIESSTPEVIKTLREAALNGDTSAAGLLLKHGLPLTSNETLIEGAETIAHLDPETRVAVIGQLVAMGRMPLEHAKAMIDLAKAESDAQLLQPLRRLMAELKTLGPEEALLRLARATDSLAILDAPVTDPSQDAE